MNHAKRNPGIPKRPNPQKNAKVVLGWRLMKPPIGYIAYIDEAGDDGIKKIRTEAESGASEWLVISAVVIHAGSHRHSREPAR